MQLLHRKLHRKLQLVQGLSAAAAAALLPQLLLLLPQWCRCVRLCVCVCVSTEHSRCDDEACVVGQVLGAHGADSSFPFLEDGGARTYRFGGSPISRAWRAFTR